MNWLSHGTVAVAERCVTYEGSIYNALAAKCWVFLISGHLFELVAYLLELVAYETWWLMDV